MATRKPKAKTKTKTKTKPKTKTTLHHHVAYLRHNHDTMSFFITPPPPAAETACPSCYEPLTITADQQLLHGEHGEHDAYANVCLSDTLTVMDVTEGQLDANTVYRVEITITKVV